MKRPFAVRVKLPDPVANDNFENEAEFVRAKVDGALDDLFDRVKSLYGTMPYTPFTKLLVERTAERAAMGARFRADSWWR